MGFSKFCASEKKIILWSERYFSVISVSEWKMMKYNYNWFKVSFICLITEKPLIRIHVAFMFIKITNDNNTKEGIFLFWFLTVIMRINIYRCKITLYTLKDFAIKRKKYWKYYCRKPPAIWRNFPVLIGEFKKNLSQDWWGFHGLRRKRHTQNFSLRSRTLLAAQLPEQPHDLTKMSSGSSFGAWENDFKIQTRPSPKLFFNQSPSPIPKVYSKKLLITS